MKSKLKCEVVQDLLPIYLDKIGSEVTNLEVKEHLEECPDCTASYEAMNTPDRITKNTADKRIRFLKKIQKRHLITTVICIISAVVILVGLYQVNEYMRVLSQPISTNDVAISDVYVLSNGTVICKVTISDDLPYYEHSALSSLTISGGKMYGAAHVQYSLYSKYFAKHNEELIDGGNYYYAVFNTPEFITVNDGEITIKGTVTLAYEGLPEEEPLIIWQNGDPLSLAPAELEEYAQMNLLEY